MQLLQIREPSPSSRRFASESRSVPQVLHRKHCMCQRFPAAGQVSHVLQFGCGATMNAQRGEWSWTHTELESFAFFENLDVQGGPCQRDSQNEQALEQGRPDLDGSMWTYLAATFARIRNVILLHRGFRIGGGRLHDGWDVCSLRSGLRVFSSITPIAEWMGDGDWRILRLVSSRAKRSSVGGRAKLSRGAKGRRSR